MDHGYRANDQPRDPIGITSTGRCDPRTTSLFHRLREGQDPAARERLIRQFMPLARWVARRYGSGDMAEDVRQVAYLGLVKAVDRFDPDRGTSFTSFGIPTIAGEVRRHFRDCGWDVHVPRGLQERVERVRRTRDALTGELGRLPSVAELATELGIAPEAVLEAIGATKAFDAASLDSPFESSAPGMPESTEPQPLLGDLDAGFERVLERDFVRVALATLSERKRQMIALRFFAEQTQPQIAARYGVSAMQVCRLLREALTEMSQAVSAGAA